jgi:signal transduction histidine kinase
MLPKENGDKTATTLPGDAGGESASAEQTIADLKKSLALTQRKLQIVGSVTRHDVLNQLTAIIGYNELLGLMITDPKLKGFVDKENLAIAKIQRQFRFSKYFQNIAVEPPIWQPLKDLVHRIREEVDLRDIQVTDESGSASVFADPLFHQVFYNLFENTVHHSVTATEINLTVRRESGYVVLIIGDNGVGIAREEKEHIFERGYGKDTGWGLFLTREILEASGMQIAEAGEPGMGARFEITMPEGMFRTGS